VWPRLAVVMTTSFVLGALLGLATALVRSG
jgi:uncharacterized protein involved in exopolysaccharide biosynthesis